MTLGVLKLGVLTLGVLKLGFFMLDVRKYKFQSVDAGANLLLAAVWKQILINRGKSVSRNYLQIENNLKSKVCKNYATNSSKNRVFTF